MPGNNQLKRGQFLVRKRDSHCQMREHFNLAQVLSTDGSRVEINFLYPAGLQGGIAVYTEGRQVRQMSNFSDWRVFAEHDFDSAEEFWRAQQCT